jgi:hypothetical protein
MTAALLAQLKDEILPSKLDDTDHIHIEDVLSRLSP